MTQFVCSSVVTIQLCSGERHELLVGGPRDPPLCINS